MGIGIGYDSASFRDCTWYKIGGVDVKEGIYIAQCAQYLQRVHLLVGRDVTRQINEDGIVKFKVQQARGRFGNGLANFNSTLILPSSGREVWASEASWSCVRSKSNVK